MRRSVALLVAAACILSALVSVPFATAHAPEFQGGNESLENATVVTDPTKSWAIYADLHEGGEAQYYRLDMLAGQIIYAQVIVPVDEGDRGFIPSFALIGPGLSSNGTPPSFVQIPGDNSTIVVNGSKPSAATYEPFTPSYFYVVGELELSAPQDGAYYLAIYDSESGGRYNVAIGEKESFTLEEWVSIPLSQLKIYQWEGQSQLTIVLPLTLTVVIGAIVLAFYARKHAGGATLFSILGSVAGLFFIGSGMSVIYQMLVSLSKTGYDWSALVTLIFALIPIVIGVYTIRLAWRMGPLMRVTRRRRITLFILGVVSLFLWAGLFVGPVLAFAASVSPEFRLNRRFWR